MRLILGVVVLAAGLFAALALRPATAYAATITGTVVDSTGAPLPAANVQVEGGGARAVSDEHGRFRLEVGAGSHTLRILVLGYRPVLRTVTLDDAGASVELRITMDTLPIPIDEVVVGSRAPHTAADELAVPVDIFEAEEIERQGTSETGPMLQSLSPSVNFPRQSVTDATDVVRPFTMRGLSPDHTLVLLDGWRRHPTAVVNTFAYGTGAGSSGVDLNALPSSAIDHIEVLRDGASAQYGSDAIAGVVNIVTRKGQFAPFARITAGRYQTGDYDADGETFNLAAGWGIPLGRGSLGVFAEGLDRQPTNRAWADPFEDSGGSPDVIDDEGNVVVKNNPVPQPNHHWGDGLEKDWLSLANLRLPLNEHGTLQVYGTGGYSFRRGTGNGYRRYAADPRNWPQIHPLGFLPEFNPDVTDWSLSGGLLTFAGPWKIDFGAVYGHNDFEYNLRNTLNASLGPSLTTPSAPGPDGTPGTGDEVPNQTEFYAGRMKREEVTTGIDATNEIASWLPTPINLSLGAEFRYETFGIEQGEYASWVDGGGLDQFGTDEAAAGSQVFAGFSPTDEADADRTNLGAYVDLESQLTPRLLANVAARVESYSDFGELLTGKAAVRYQPASPLVLRAAASTGFRAPGLGQVNFSKVVTNVIGGTPTQVGVFPVDHPASQALGSKPLEEETSVNLSAGFAITPVTGLTITADWFHVDIDDRILLGATFDDSITNVILDNGGFTNIDAVQYFTNGLDTRTQGVDIGIDWNVPIGGTQTLQLSALANYTKNEITRVDPLPDVLVQAGSTEAGLLDEVTRVAIEEERPLWRGTLTANHSLGRLHSLARVSYFGEFASAQPGFCDDCREEYGAKTLFDAEVGWKFDFLDLSLGARNLFDAYPDQPQQDFNNNFGVFPWAAASPFGYNGRYIYTRASLSLARDD